VRIQADLDEPTFKIPAQGSFRSYPQD